MAAIYTANHTEMIEVFKTNVQDRIWAQRITSALHRHFIHIEVNFDLTDRDRILRVVYPEWFDPKRLITVLAHFGFKAEILPDDVDDSFLSI